MIIYNNLYFEFFSYKFIIFLFNTAVHLVKLVEISSCSDNIYQYCNNSHSLHLLFHFCCFDHCVCKKENQLLEGHLVLYY